MGNSNTKIGGSPSNELADGKFLKDIQLNDEHFELRDGRVYLKDEQTSGLIAFYAPWCHFCVELAPEWNKYAKEMNTKSFKFLAVDCTSNKCQKIVDMLNINGFPTIKYIDPKTHEIVSTDNRDGSKLNRSRDGIMEFLRKKKVL